jgi:hypothetical protein
MSVQYKVQLVVVAADGSESTEDLIVLNKQHERLEQLGLTLAEGKQLLREVQQRVLAQQTAAFLAAQTACPGCGRQRSTKDHKTLGLRTLFGKVALVSPRLRQCCRQPDEAASISPLTRLVSEWSTPELQYLEARWASLPHLRFRSRLAAAPGSGLAVLPTSAASAASRACAPVIRTRWASQPLLG